MHSSQFRGVLIGVKGGYGNDVGVAVTAVGVRVGTGVLVIVGVSVRVRVGVRVGVELSNGVGVMVPDTGVTVGRAEDATQLASAVSRTLKE